MDWIDPRYASDQQISQEPQSKRKRARQKAKPGKLKPDSKSSKPLAAQVRAALAQRLTVWSAAYGNSLALLKWPAGVSPEATFMWSTVIQEQAEVLARAGLPAQKLAHLVAQSSGSADAGLEAAESARLTHSVQGLFDHSLESIAFRWLDVADAHADAALGTAAIGWYLAEHARRPDGDWLPQWLNALLDRCALADFEHSPSSLNALVLRCELPLLVCLATAASRRSLLTEATAAMDDLAEQLECGADEPAGWLAHGATYLRACLASVLRSRVLADGLGLRKWYPPQQRALAELLKHAARWSRRDGTQLLGAARTPARSQAIWRALTNQTRAPKSLLETMKAVGLPGSTSPAAPNCKLAPITHFSEDACAAVMQSDWRQKGSRLAVDYSDRTMCIEALGPKGVPVLAGEWPVAVERDGQAEMQLDEWTHLCWFSDDDVDYLEVEAKFGHAARVQRQAILFREDRWLFIGDALLCDEPGNWTLISKLPLASQTAFETDPRMSEGYIVTPRGGRCLTLPLYLPEWRRQTRAATLEPSPNELVMRNQTEGRQRLYSPMLISLCNRHAKRPFTWRHLTVGEDLRIVGQDEAVAYRVQSGKEQLLLYRTLAPPMRRTALGLHTLCEFYAGRFGGDDGNLDTLVEVEANL
jgi:hypothetical protein